MNILSNDHRILQLVEADAEMRKQSQRYKGVTMYVEAQWSVIKDPWAVVWEGKDGELCQMQIVSPPLEGEELVMVLATADAREFINLVFFKADYVSVRAEMGEKGKIR